MALWPDSSSTCTAEVTYQSINHLSTKSNARIRIIIECDDCDQNTAISGHHLGLRGVCHHHRGSGLLTVC